MCRSKIPPLPSRRNQQRGAYQRTQGQGQSQLQVRQIQKNLTKEEQNEQTKIESMNPEMALYITVLAEYWADVNHMSPKIFNPVKISVLNEGQPEEIWVETTTSNQHKIRWFADTGSPRSFITLDKAKAIVKKNPKMKLQP